MGNVTKGKGTKGTTTTKGKGKGTKGTKGTPQYTYNPPPPVTPKNRKGTSTVPNPVGTVWVTCLNLTAGNGGKVLPRKVYTSTCINLGVTYYTVRTQVQKYLQYTKGKGTLPNGITQG